jgi:hypothetical protein
MSIKPRGPVTSLGQPAVPSFGASPVGASLADPLAELEAAADRAERWAEAARSRAMVAPADRGGLPADTTRRARLGRRGIGEG